MAKCKVSDVCGSCKYIGKPYELQLAEKMHYIEELFGKYTNVNSIIPCSEPYYYRNKVNFPFKRVRGGAIIYGTYEAGSHRIVERDKCMIENKKAQEIAATIRDIAKKRKMSIYDERTGIGLLRRVLIRVSETTGQIMVVIVTGQKYFVGKTDFIKELRTRHPEITTILTNLNERRDSMILGSMTKKEYGKGYIEDIILGKKFRISPESFFQVNTKQAELLYTEAMFKSGIMKYDKVLDCYCGTGTISCIAAALSDNVTGVELNPHAVADAVINAKKNKIEGVRFVQADATEYMTEAAREGIRYDVVIMDPPRAGSTERFIHACTGMAPNTVVYISCNPDTLMRDALLFFKLGYEMQELTPVDMFPWTDDIECVAVFRRRNP